VAALLTCVPLVLFAEAIKGLRLSTLSICYFLAPTLTWVISVAKVTPF
jgi:EamA domain-containing membrane protein RarD